LIRSDEEYYSIKYGLIELKGGWNISVDNLDVHNMNISEYSLIKINKGISDVNIKKNKFVNVTKIKKDSNGLIDISKYY
jgi:hypothetical protein